MNFGENFDLDKMIAAAVADLPILPTDDDLIEAVETLLPQIVEWLSLQAGTIAWQALQAHPESSMVALPDGITEIEYVAASAIAYVAAFTPEDMDELRSSIARKLLASFGDGPKKNPTTAT